MWQRRHDRKISDYFDYVTASRPYSLRYDEEEALLSAMGPDLPSEKIHGEWIGLIKTSVARLDGAPDARWRFYQAARFPATALRRSF